MTEPSKPATTKLLLAERSNKAPGEGSAEQILPSSTSRKLDELCPGWQDAFVVRNIWKDKEDDAPANDRIKQILEETDPDVVVTLGITVSLALEVKYHSEWLSWSTVHGLPVLKFPHTSGRNRSWNDPQFVERASGALRAIATASDIDEFILATAGVEGDTEAPAPEQNESSADETVPRPAKTLVKAKTKRLPKDFVHEIKSRFYKVEKLYTGVCTCGWSVSASKKRDTESNVEKHLEDKNK